MFPRGNKYKYSNSRIIISKKDGDTLTYIRGATGFRDRDTHIEFENLEQGDYQMLIEINWEPETQDRVFCATSYGKSKVQFGDCNSEKPIQEILKPIFKAKALQAAESPDSYPDVTISNFAEEKGP
jgi:hypothetical protein